jgi:hypothetical protein
LSFQSLLTNSKLYESTYLLRRDGNWHVGPITVDDEIKCVERAWFDAPTPLIGKN